MHAYFNWLKRQRPARPDWTPRSQGKYGRTLIHRIAKPRRTSRQSSEHGTAKLLKATKVHPHLKPCRHLPPTALLWKRQTFSAWAAKARRTAFMKRLEKATF